MPGAVDDSQKVGVVFDVIQTCQAYAVVGGIGCHALNHLVNVRIGQVITVVQLQSSNRYPEVRS